MDYLDGIADRIAPAFSYILPFTWLSFASLFAMRLNSAHVWGFGEAFITVARVLGTCDVGVVLYQMDLVRKVLIRKKLALDR